MFSKQNQSQIFPAADRGGRQRTEQHKLQRRGYYNPRRHPKDRRASDMRPFRLSKGKIGFSFFGLRNRS